MTIQTIKALAEALHEKRQAVNALKESIEVPLQKLEEERDQLQLDLIESLKGNDLSSIKLSSGDNYALARRKGIAIINDSLARKWAIENDAFSVDRRMVAEKLKDVDELPKAFVRVETEFISIRKAKPKQELTIEEDIY